LLKTIIHSAAGVKARDWERLRPLLAAIVAICVAFDAGFVARGAFGAGTLPQYGSLRSAGGTRVAYRSITPQGAAIGLAPRDTFDTAELSFAQRARFYFGIGGAGDSIVIPMHRGAQQHLVRATFVARRGSQLPEWLLFALAMTSALAGILCLWRGRYLPSFIAGLFLVALALRSLVLTFPPWDGPLAIAATIFIVNIWAKSAFLAFGLLFALSLLQKETSPRLRAALAVFATIAIAGRLFFGAFDYSLAFFTGASLFGAGLYVWFEIALLVLLILILGIATYDARDERLATVRILFASTLVGATAEIANDLYPILANNAPSTAWLIVYVLLWSVLFAGYLHAFFARHLIAFDFFISRAVIFGTIVAFITSIVVLTENVIGHLALPRGPGAGVEIGVTLVIAFSFKWGEAKIEHFAEQVFYRDKRRAHDALERFTDELPFIRETRELGATVTSELQRCLNVPGVVIYSSQAGGYAPVACTLARGGEPEELSPSALPQAAAARGTFELTAGTVFPIVAYGRLFGYLLIYARLTREKLDREERRSITQLAHQYGVACAFAARDEFREEASL